MFAQSGSALAAPPFAAPSASASSRKLVVWLPPALKEPTLRKAKGPLVDFDIRAAFEASEGRTVLVDVSATTSKALQLRIKRMIDVLGAAVLLVLTSPLLVLTAVAIRLTSPGPAIFRQERIGLDGCRFVMWKFRSMLVDQRALIDLDDVYDVGNARLIKREDDPRITPIGRVIRTDEHRRAATARLGDARGHEPGRSAAAPSVHARAVSPVDGGAVSNAAGCDWALAGLGSGCQ